MANVKNIQRVIRSIEAEEALGFNMATYRDRVLPGVQEDMSGRHCGTVACIAGHAVATLETANLTHPADGYFETARKLLGLRTDEAAALFYGHGARRSLDHITVAEALGTLCHLAETGQVDWGAGERRADAAEQKQETEDTP